MNKNFFVVDRFNSVVFSCTSLFRFNYNNFDYLVYYLVSNGENCNVFVSRLISHDGIYYLIDISKEEKGFIGNIVHDAFVNLPTSFSKEAEVNGLVRKFMEEHNIVFSKDIPNMKEQSLLSNSCLVQSNLKYANYVKSLYDYICLSVDFNFNNSLVWNLPSSDSNNMNFKTISNYNTLQDAQPSVSITTGFDNEQSQIGNQSIIIPISSTPSELNKNIGNSSISTSSSYNYIGTNSYSFNQPDSLPFNTNLQGSNMNYGSNSYNGINYNFVSQNWDDASSGGPSLESNKVKVLNKKNAGFASNRYIIIGTVCFILAAIVIGLFIFSVRNL